MSLSHSNVYDVIIVGAGPAGLACAIESGRQGLSSLIIDKGNIVDSIQHFQREMAFFSTPELLEIGNIPFVIPGTRPSSVDCVKYYRRVSEVCALKCHLYDEVCSIKNNGGGFRVQTVHGNEFVADAVVVATGYYDSPNPLGVPGENLPFVSHYYRDPLPYYGRRVLIVGGKNSAVEAALDLYRHGATVTVVHRGATLSSGVKYWILSDFENRVKDGSIRLLLSTVAKQFQPGCATLQDGSGKQRVEETDAVFLLIGYRPNVAFLRSAGIGVDPETLAPLHDPSTYETDVPRMFVAGGIVGGKLNNKVFIENGREHGKRILEALNK